MRRGPARWAGAVLAAAALLLGGCVSVPTSGPVEKVVGQQPACQNCVNVEVAPPAADDGPQQIVEGYLRATSNYQPNYSVAKQFLTRAASERWSAEDGVLVYRGSPEPRGDTVVLDDTLVGSLGKDRVYTARDDEFRWDFEMVKENGEWRISRPPPGLMVAEFSFTTFFQSYELFFVGNGNSLVPEPIYLPVLRNPANVASALVKALLDGPSRWLAPAVTSAIPPETKLSVDSVTVNEGIAEVPLSDTVTALPDELRSLLAAQLVYTLKQAAGVKGVLITVNQQKFRVPESDPTSLAIPVTAISRDLDPVPVVGGEQLYTVHNGRAEAADPNAQGQEAVPVKGAFGAGRIGVSSLAVSVANTDIAAVTDDGTRLRTATIADGSVRTVLEGVTDLLRPQYTRYGELLAIGRKGKRQQLWMGDGSTARPVRTTIFDGGEVVAFKVSPAGARMAVVRRTRTGTELGIARITRSESVFVDGWRRLDLTQSERPQITRILDVGWWNATDLVVLGAPTPDGTVGTYRVSEDASQITSEGDQTDWDPREVTVLLRRQTAVVVGDSGQTWKDDGTQWMPYLRGISTAAFPG